MKSSKKFVWDQGEEKKLHWSLAASQVCVIWGTGTDVGKTFAAHFILDSNICHWYYKPIQTGGWNTDGPQLAQQHPKTHVETGLIAEEPLSPDLAFSHFDPLIFQQQIYQKTLWLSDMGPGILETAGGAFTPLPHGVSQCDFYQNFGFSSLLLVSGELGGISQGLSTLQALQSRGVDPFLILVQHNKKGNFDSLSRQKILSHLPVALLEEKESWLPLVQDCFEKKPHPLDSFQKTLNKGVWWPLTQQKNLDGFFWVEQTKGPWLMGHKVAPQKSPQKIILYDATLSWWSVASPRGQGISPKLQETLSRVGHVFHPQIMTKALDSFLEFLLPRLGGKWAQRCFFASDGSSSVEIALKMGLKLAQKRGLPTKKVLGLKGSYHGDTRAASDVSSFDDFFLQDLWRQKRGIWLDFPEVTWNQDWQTNFQTYDTLEDLMADEDRLKHYKETLKENLKDQWDEIGILLLEPLMHGASGFHFVDPLFQKALIQLCQKRGVVIILDEIFSGCGRFGFWSAAEILDIQPDLACFSKWLTGGLPLAITLTNEETYQLYWSSEAKDAFLHSHTFAANPPALAAALDHLLWMEQNAISRSFESFWVKEVWSFLERTQSLWQRAFSLGHLLVYDLKLDTSSSSSNSSSYWQTSKTFQKSLEEAGFWCRPLGSVFYLQKVPDFSPEEQKNLLREFERGIWRGSCK